jgi:hypothetical protein
MPIVILGWIISAQFNSLRNRPLLNQNIDSYRLTKRSRLPIVLSIALYLWFIILKPNLLKLGFLFECILNTQGLQSPASRTGLSSSLDFASWHSGQFHSVSLIHCPDEIRHNSAGIPAVPFKEPLLAYSRAYFRFQRNNAMNAMEAIDRDPCICMESATTHPAQFHKSGQNTHVASDITFMTSGSANHNHSHHSCSALCQIRIIFQLLLKYELSCACSNHTLTDPRMKLLGLFRPAISVWLIRSDTVLRRTGVIAKSLWFS